MYSFYGELIEEVIWQDKDDDDGWLTFWAKSTYPSYGKEEKKEKEKKPSPEELAKRRHDALEAAARDVDLLLDLSMFRRHPRGLLFELSRCWSLKVGGQRLYLCY